MTISLIVNGSEWMKMAGYWDYVGTLVEFSYTKMSTDSMKLAWALHDEIVKCRVSIKDVKNFDRLEFHGQVERVLSALKKGEALHGELGRSFKGSEREKRWDLIGGHWSPHAICIIFSHLLKKFLIRVVSDFLRLFHICRTYDFLRFIAPKSNPTESQYHISYSYSKNRYHLLEHTIRATRESFLLWGEY
jgi:hypothetical protein